MEQSSFLSKLSHVICYYAPAIVMPLFTWFLGLSDDRRPFTEAKTVILATVAKAIFNDPTPVSMLEEQQKSRREIPVGSSVWVYNETFSPLTDHDLSDTLLTAVTTLTNHKVNISKPIAVPVKGEWVGHRNKPDSQDKVDDRLMSDEEIHNNLMQDTKSSAVLLYLHGGQFYLRNPASRRDIVHALTERTGGRCFSIAYRLSPQNAFPSAILDLLVVYLSLLYPSADSRHKPVSARSICICGDSSGGNIAVAFLQLLIHLQDQASAGNGLVRWDGTSVKIPLPAGVCTHSAYMDLTRSLPSEVNNLKYDIIPSPEIPPAPAKRYIADSLWPTHPRRHHVYAPTMLLTHPLISPVTAKSWESCPTKIWMSTGQECLMDANILLAKNMSKQGVDVSLEIFEGMPHDFLVLLQSSTCGQACLDSWSAFVQDISSEKQVGNKFMPESGSATIHGVNGLVKTVLLADMEPRRTREELTRGMEAKIRDWGEP